jgi:hypothetical protein
MSAIPVPERALPLLLVDVDGVISLWGWPEPHKPVGAWTLVDGVPHYLSAEAAGRLAALTDVFEPIWCTGWEEKADEHLPRLVGLGPFPHLSFDRAMSGAASRAHWKLAAIDAHAGPDRPLAWVDDAFNPACHAWAAARPGPTLLVTTEPAVGVTEPQAAQLRAWAADPATPAEPRFPRAPAG